MEYIPDQFPWDYIMKVHKYQYNSFSKCLCFSCSIHRQNNGLVVDFPSWHSHTICHRFACTIPLSLLPVPLSHIAGFGSGNSAALHCKNKRHLHVSRWDTCVLKETHTHVYGQTYMFLNERMRFCKLHITCFTITRHVLLLHIGCFKITHWVF